MISERSIEVVSIIKDKISKEKKKQWWTLDLLQICNRVELKNISIPNLAEKNENLSKSNCFITVGKILV